MNEASSRPLTPFLLLALLLVLAVPGALILFGLGPDASETSTTLDATPPEGSEAPAPHLEGRPDARGPVEAAIDAAPVPSTMPAVGRVVAVDSTPVAGAKVEVLVGRKKAAHAEVGDDGRFELAVPVGLACRLVVQAPGYATVLLERRFRFVAEATLDLGELLLESARHISGRVVTKGGQPVEGASLELRPEADPVPPSWLHRLSQGESFVGQESDAEGRFTFASLPPGRYRVLLYTEEAWYGDQVREHVEAGAEDVDFVVPDSERLFDVTLKIRVVGPDDLPVPKAQVRLWGGSSLGMTVYGKEETELAIEAASDPVRLLVWDAREEDDTPLGYAPVVIDGVRSQAGTLIVRMEAGFEVAGRVLWDGEPRVWVLQASTFRSQDGRWGSRWEDGEDPIVNLQTRTDAEGNFRFRGLPRGEAGIGLFNHEGPGRLKNHGVITSVPATGVLLETIATGTIHIVLRAPPDLMVRSTSVTVEQWVDGGVRDVYSSQTSVGSRSRGKPEFSYEAGGLEMGGHFRIIASGSCGGRYCGPIEVDDVRIRDEPYVVVLEGGSRIVGRVVHPDGSPAVGAQVHPRLLPGGAFVSYEWKPAGLASRWVLTNERGEFEIDAPEGAEYLFAIYAPGWTSLVDPMPVKAGDMDVRLVAHPEQSITGRIRDEAGNPADGFRVAGVPAAGVPVLWAPTRSAADGFFEASVGPGAWRVSVWNERDDQDLRYALSDALPAGTRDVRLTLAPGAALAGRVLSASGSPVSSSRVWVLGSAVNRRALANDEGRFLVHGIPPGRYEVFVRTPTGAEHTISAAVSTVGEPTELDLVLR